MTKIELFNYLQYLVGTNNGHAGAIDSALLTRYEGLDKAGINQLFFKDLESGVFKMPKSRRIVIKPEILVKLKENITSLVSSSSECSILRDRIAGLAQDMAFHTSRYLASKASLEEAYQKLEIAEKMPPIHRIDGIIEQVQTNEHWVFTNVDTGGRIEFATRYPVMMTYNGSTINLGRFKMRLGLISRTIAFFKYSNNISTSGYIHPHISGGSPCLGNAHEAMHKALADKDYSKVFTLAWHFLCAYNENSPYKAFSYFQEEYIKRNRYEEVEDFAYAHYSNSEDRIGTARFITDNGTDTYYLFPIFRDTLSDNKARTFYYYSSGRYYPISIANLTTTEELMVNSLSKDSAIVHLPSASEAVDEYGTYMIDTRTNDKDSSDEGTDTVSSDDEQESV